MDKPHMGLLAWQKSMRLVVDIYELNQELSSRRNLWAYLTDSSSGCIGAIKY